MGKTKTCPKCGGSGELDHCGRCNGSGKVTCSTCGGSGEIKDSCRACNGTGKITKTRLKNCSRCHGQGQLRDGGNCGICDGSGQVEDHYDDVCPNCNGTGYFGSGRKCSACNGEGHVICPTCHGNAHTRSTCDRCGGTGKVEVSSSSSSSSEEGTWWEAVLGLLVLIGLCWGGWRGYKWLFSERGSEVITEAAIMEKWQEHLEKRREAFDDGLPEKDIEAKGLRNYTWDEWQEKFKKEHEAQTKQEGSGKTRAQEIGEQTLSTAKDLGDKAKSLWQNLTSNPMADLWHEHQDKRRKLLSSGMDQKKVEDMGYEALTFDEFKARYKDKNVEAELKRLNSRLAELEGPATSSKKSSKSTSYKVTMTGNEATVTVTSENDTRQDAWQAAIRTAVKGAVSAFVGNRKLIEANKDSLEKCLDTVSKADLKRCNVIKDLQIGEVFTVVIEARIDKKDIAPKFARVFPDAFTMSKVAAPIRPAVPASNAELEAKAQAEAAARARAEAEAKRLANEMARKNAEAEARIKAEAVARAKAEAEAKRLAEELARKDAAAKAQAEAATRIKAGTKAKAPTGAEGAVGGQQSGGAVRKASKDSKGIRIIVQGKGKTMDAAVRWAIRDAVWRTVGTWVDSKTRIKENHDRVVAQVKTITEADVHKFEVLDTQMQDGGFIIKVRVSVSKKKIAPKFAEIFPDVFGNVND